MAPFLKLKVHRATKVLVEIGVDITNFLVVVADLLVLVDDFSGITKVVTSRCMAET